MKASLNSRALETDRRVAALALGAELPEVDVVLAMAGCAVRRQLHFRRWLAVAVDALQASVLARKRKIGLAAMVELPVAPGVRGMAGSAVLAESAFVHIAALVTAEAILRCTLERLRAMTLRAGHEHMHAEQRIVGEIMVEADVLAPRIGAMARIAARLQRAAMRVRGGMTADAVLAELLRRNGGRVASVAVELEVAAEECVLGFDGMVVLER